LSDPPGLLSGVRILSFGTFVAGNSPATLLASLGAEVAKVEARKRPEVLRTPAYAIGEPVTEPSGAPNTVMYASLTRGLRNLSLDMSSPAARSLVHRLVSVSDVVIENFGGSVLRGWGCSYEELLADRPNLVMLSFSGYGRTGPRANYLAYASTMASYIGLGSAWGYNHGTFSDYITAVTGAVAAVAALIEARRTGTPTYLDVAQVDAVPPVLVEIYAGPLNGRQDEPHPPNRTPGSWLSGVYPCTGTDQWVAVDIEDADDWVILCRVLDRADLVVSDRDEALAFEDRLSGALASWVSRYSSHSAMHHLQRAGLAAVAVQDYEALYRDMQLRSRDFLERVFQRDLGYVMYPGSPQRWTRTPGHAPIPPARLGEHTRDILQRWIDLGDDEIVALEAEGAVFCAG
jgi:crotonobetainyl-CoA:carnitine CoA-transferase CaiB-like acyl-CoA transferase